MKKARLLGAQRQNIFLLAIGLGLSGCGREMSPVPFTPRPITQSAAAPRALVLAPHEGEGRIDAEIRGRQVQIRDGDSSSAGMERLGWLFISKARQSYDPGFYKLAEQCALVIEEQHPGSSEGLLLRGHALQSQHRFAEAEAIARELVRKRGLAFDYGLLGDIQVDQGQVDLAANAYQAMLDLKPDPQGYARAAHIRWIKGDPDGAVELMEMASRGVSPRDPEAAAWMQTQLARYLWQNNRENDAGRALDGALQFEVDYAPALLLRGRMFLGKGQKTEAIPLLRKAAQANPLPEYLWVLAEALRAAGLESEAGDAERELARSGPASDPRTWALFMAERRQNVPAALAAAQEELGQRQDVFTHDAVAWALLAAERPAEAHAQMSRALVHGTADARLHYHAAVIATHAGHLEAAHSWLARAESCSSLLLPGEQQQLATIAARLRQSTPARASNATPAPHNILSTAIETAAAKN